MSRVLHSDAERETMKVPKILKGSLWSLLHFLDEEMKKAEDSASDSNCEDLCQGIRNSLEQTHVKCTVSDVTHALAAMHHMFEKDILPSNLSNMISDNNLAEALSTIADSVDLNSDDDNSSVEDDDGNASDGQNGEDAKSDDSVSDGEGEEEEEEEEEEGDDEGDDREEKVSSLVSAARKALSEDTVYRRHALQKHPPVMAAKQPRISHVPAASPKKSTVSSKKTQAAKSGDFLIGTDSMVEEVDSDWDPDSDGSTRAKKTSPKKTAGRNGHVLSSPPTASTPSSSKPTNTSVKLSQAAPAKRGPGRPKKVGIGLSQPTSIGTPTPGTTMTSSQLQKSPPKKLEDVTINDLVSVAPTYDRPGGGGDGLFLVNPPQLNGGTAPTDQTTTNPKKRGRKPKQVPLDGLVANGHDNDQDDVGAKPVAKKRKNAKGMAEPVVDVPADLNIAELIFENRSMKEQIKLLTAIISQRMQ